MNRRTALVALSAAVAGMLTACASTSDIPATVATDAGLIASGLAGAFASVSAVPSAVTTALSDMASAAQALGSADTTAAAQPLVQRIEADVNAVVAAVAALPGLPAGVSTAITAAQVLLAVIEAGVNLVVSASAAPGTMTPAEARLILAGLAAKR